LTATLAHYVNNALTGVIGCLELALQRPRKEADVDAWVQSGLDCAYEAADAVRRIVDCTRRVAQADPREPHSLRRLAEEAAEERSPMATVVGASAAQVLVSADLVRLALDKLLAVVAPEGGVRLRVADENGRSVLYVEGGAAGGPELRQSLLEPSLIVEVQGGALEVLSAPTGPASLKVSFPCLAAGPLRRDDAQNAPPAPHRPAAIGLFRHAV
jgi:hypothetical protein